LYGLHSAIYIRDLIATVECGTEVVNKCAEEQNESTNRKSSGKVVNWKQYNVSLICM